MADRRDDLVISGGDPVYQAEVEAALDAHPVVEAGGVAGRADPTWGAVPVAGIVLRPGRRTRATRRLGIVQGATGHLQGPRSNSFASRRCPGPAPAS